MYFIDTEDDIEQCMGCRIVSDDGLIQIGVHPVLYGVRVRAGRVNSQFYNLDYCAGADQHTLESIYYFVRKILEDNHGDFELFPPQLKKPFNLDTDNWLRLIELAGGYPESIPSIEPIPIIRKKLLSQHEDALKALGIKL